MKVFYHSSLTNTELTVDGAFRTVPCKSYLELQREKSDGHCELIYNGTIIPSDTERRPRSKEKRRYIPTDKEATFPHGKPSYKKNLS